MDRDKKIMLRLESDYKMLEEKGYEVVAVFLYGSQNYGLDTPESDIDTKAIVLPKFNDFVKNKALVSTSLELPENREFVDVKDVRLMFENLKKQNINFLEVLFTNYKVVNPKYMDLLSPVFENRERVARYNVYKNLNAMVGMAFEKRKALTHPYPSLVEKLEKFGYDPKQLHHILRLEEFITRYLARESYVYCLVSKRKEYLKAVKAGTQYSLKEAVELADESCARMKETSLNYMKFFTNDEDPYVGELLEAAAEGMLRRAFREELMKEEVL